jgi:hypothetical protein
VGEREAGTARLNEGERSTNLTMVLDYYICFKYEVEKALKPLEKQTGRAS